MTELNAQSILESEALKKRDDQGARYRSLCDTIRSLKFDLQPLVIHLRLNGDIKAQRLDKACDLVPAAVD